MNLTNTALVDNQQPIDCRSAYQPKCRVVPPSRQCTGRPYAMRPYR
jgi:hypothetical protein